MQTHRPCFSRLNNYWLWEATLCVGSLFALLAVIGVLWFYDGKPIPDWPYGTTINSVLSWLTQVLTASMVGTVAPCLSQSKWIYFSTGTRPLIELDWYDWASRGPLGCTVFLWTSRMRRSATFGALITVLAIGIGPFVQQMATVRNQHVQTDDPASVTRAELYYETSNYSDVSSETVFAVFGAVFENSNASSLIAPKCPTGNCDIAPFRSLAVCSECIDVSHLLSLSMEQLPCISISTYKHTLPNGVHLNITQDPSVKMGYLSTGAKPMYQPGKRLPGTTDFGDSTVLDFDAITVPQGENLTNATATHCSLYWCVNTYSVGMTNNVVQERLVDTYYDPNAQFKDEILKIGPRVEANLTSTDFYVNQDSAILLNEWLVDKFNIANQYDYYCRTKTFTVRTSRDYSLSDEFVWPLLNTQMPDLFSRLAAALTTHVRKVGLRAKNATAAAFDVAPAEHAPGISWTMETQIHVRWAWIILPALLILSAIIFLGLTILQTKRSGLDVRKSSCLPLLYSGLDEDIQKEMRIEGDLTQAEGLAEQISVRLVKDGSLNEWRLESMDAIVD
ncbi:hypothetical protein BDV59DRAFT_185456 [Aspergillus ambiguus]|uniref:DUF3176 domain-containing protein n=1 Tax=Aspergillus ambiguus TaxID=176160 RepID=UPI003CCD48CD